MNRCSHKSTSYCIREGHKMDQMQWGYFYIYIFLSRPMWPLTVVDVLNDQLLCKKLVKSPKMSEQHWPVGTRASSSCLCISSLVEEFKCTKTRLEMALRVPRQIYTTPWLCLHVYLPNTKTQLIDTDVLPALFDIVVF